MKIKELYNPTLLGEKRNGFLKAMFDANIFAPSWISGDSNVLTDIDEFIYHKIGNKKLLESFQDPLEIIGSFYIYYRIAHVIENYNYELKTLKETMYFKYNPIENYNMEEKESTRGTHGNSAHTDVMLYGEKTTTNATGEQENTFEHGKKETSTTYGAESVSNVYGEVNTETTIGAQGTTNTYGEQNTTNTYGETNTETKDGRTKNTRELSVATFDSSSYTNKEKEVVTNEGETNSTSTTESHTDTSERESYTDSVNVSNRNDSTKVYAHTDESTTLSHTDITEDKTYTDTNTVGARSDIITDSSHSDTFNHGAQSVSINDMRELARKGNIGVTTTQQMIEQERNIALFCFAEKVTEILLRECTSLCWECD